MQLIFYKTNQGYSYNKQLANLTMTTSSTLLTQDFCNNFLKKINTLALKISKILCTKSGKIFDK